MTAQVLLAQRMFPKQLLTAALEIDHDGFHDRVPLDSQLEVDSLTIATDDKTTRLRVEHSGEPQQRTATMA